MASPTADSASRPVNCLVCEIRNVVRAILRGQLLANHLFNIVVNGETVCDLDLQDHAVADRVEIAEKLDPLAFQHEIGAVDLRARIVDSSVLLATHDTRRGVKHRLAGMDVKVVDRAEGAG